MKVKREEKRDYSEQTTEKLLFIQDKINSSEDFKFKKFLFLLSQNP